MADISWTEYVDKYGDLKKAWGEIEAGSGDQFDYWNPLGATSKKEFGRKHWELEGSKNKNRNLNPKVTSTDTSTRTATQPTRPDLPTYDKPDKPVTPGPEDRPDYAGPDYVDWRTEDPTPVGITLAEVQDDELVENRLANLLDKNSPLFREAAEAAMRRMGGRGLGRNVSMANEEVMSAIFKVAQPIVMADALMLERHRTLRNTAYYQQMNSRLTGAIQEALAHVAGGYQIQATMINDITNRWKSQLAADIQAYGVDVGAAAKIYGVDVAAEVQLYDTDVKKWLGMEGLKVKFAEVYSNIEDNAEAAAFLWDMVFGDNDLNPSEWVTAWSKKFGNAAGQSSSSSSDSGTMTSTQSTQFSMLEDQWNDNVAKTPGKWDRIMALATSQGIGQFWKDKYIRPGT
tara:strand:+ start:92 stop:1294 length:1203 start_codon:yes stop_codon:yes gene_type:complete